MYSVGPLYMITDPRLPSYGSGLPLTDKSDWERCHKIANVMKTAYAPLVNEWLEIEYPEYPKFSLTRMYQSTNLNIHMYPSALMNDYLKLCPLGEEYLNIDHSIREPFGNFEIPEGLKKRPGKLIYLSLGSLSSSFVELMKRLISILSKSEHKFIVAKGHRHNEYELAENMWGEQFVPHLAILPQVDLVLIHGGNNSFIESLYFGKPMVVLPLFGDQFDNAQRAAEANIALRVIPFKVTEIELNNAIESVLYNEIILKNVTRVSEEMKKSKSMERAVDRIEHVAEHPKFPTIA